MKSVVITGSTRGIGYGLADAFLERGCQVVINGRSQSSVDNALKQLVQKHGQDHLFGFPAAVADATQVAALWEFAQTKLGQIDIWVNNAGLGHDTLPLWQLPAKEADTVITVNVLGTTYGTQIAMNGMLAQGQGQIYNMEGFGSNGSTRFGMSIYGTSKAAVHYLTKSVAKEAKDTAVQIGSLEPGMVMTDLVLDRFKKKPEELEKVRKIFNIIADTVDNVAPWLVDKMLANTKNGARIVYAPPIKLAGRFISAPFTKRNVFED